MKAIVDKVRAVILSKAYETNAAFGGPWGEMQKEGTAVWVEIPANEIIEDCDLTGGETPSLVVNAARKSARLAALTAKDSVKQRITAYDDDTASTAQAKQFRKDMKEAIKTILGG